MKTVTLPWRRHRSNRCPPGDRPLSCPRPSQDLLHADGCPGQPVPDHPQDPRQRGAEAGHRGAQERSCGPGGDARRDGGPVGGAPRLGGALSGEEDVLGRRRVGERSGAVRGGRRWRTADGEGPEGRGFGGERVDRDEICRDAHHGQWRWGRQADGRRVRRPHRLRRARSLVRAESQLWHEDGPSQSRGASPAASSSSRQPCVGACVPGQPMVDGTRTPKRVSR